MTRGRWAPVPGPKRVKPTVKWLPACPWCGKPGRAWIQNYGATISRVEHGVTSSGRFVSCGGHGDPELEPAGRRNRPDNPNENPDPYLQGLPISTLQPR